MQKWVLLNDSETLTREKTKNSSLWNVVSPKDDVAGLQDSEWRSFMIHWSKDKLVTKSYKKKRQIDGS